MVVGYPGRTNRHRLPSEVAFTFDWNYPEFVKSSGGSYGLLPMKLKAMKLRV